MKIARTHLIIQMTTEREDLIEEARERWDDEWFLQMVEHADGDQHRQIHHSRESIADGVIIRDIMTMDGDSFDVNRWLIDNTEYVTQVDTDTTEGMKPCSD